MKRIADPERRTGVRSSTVVLAFLALLISAPAVRAACDGPAPAFDAAIAEARTIVIGEIVQVREGGMTLRVDRVLKGSAPATLDLSEFWPHPCAGPFRAAEGDVIAIAFGVGEFEGRDISPVAYLEGEPYRNDIEVLTVVEVFDLAGVPLADTAAIASRSVSWLVPMGLVLAVLGAIALFATGRRVDQ